MIVKKEYKASVLVINYNSEEYIEKCIKTLLSQTFKNLEIIFFDDNSSDNSINEIIKFKNIKIIRNNEINRTPHGSYNQMEGLRLAFEKSTGDIIFTLDSDDYFDQNKIEVICDLFRKIDKKIISDLPIVDTDGSFSKMRTKNIFSIFRHFPYFPQQSCLAFKRETFDQILKDVNIRKFPNVWFDFRAALYGSRVFNEFHIERQYLTFYRLSKKNISSNFKKFSKAWWKRRQDYHDYEKFFLERNSLIFNKSLDYYVTKLFNYFYDSK